MDARFRQPMLYAAMLLFVAGCQTPFALHKNTVNLGGTVADIHQQQVLDNLAKFVADPYALPSFALANSGTSDITDSCNGGLTVSWIATGFENLGLNYMGSRQKQNNWTVTPITDPRKLELMRCAYQRAVGPCTGIGESNCCPDCQKRFNEFYTGRAEPKPTEDAAGAVYTSDSTSVSGAIADLPLPCADYGIGAAPGPDGCNACPTESAKVTADCLNINGCWFHFGCKKRVPKNCGYVGHYCNTYVWVCPGPDRDELTKLTLAILDYATYDGIPQLPAKTVTAYITADGCPATEAEANFVVQATIPSDELSKSVIKPELDLATCPPSKDTTERTMRSMDTAPIPSLRALPPQRTPMPNTNLLFWQQQLNTVR